MSFDDDFESIFGAILPVPEPQVKIVEDEDRLSLGSRELVIINSPGHAPHHIAIFDTKTKGLFCGEALGLTARDLDQASQESACCRAVPMLAQHRVEEIPVPVDRPI